MSWGSLPSLSVSFHVCEMRDTLGGDWVRSNLYIASAQHTLGGGEPPFSLMRGLDACVPGQPLPWQGAGEGFPSQGLKAVRPENSMGQESQVGCQVRPRQVDPRSEVRHSRCIDYRIQPKILPITMSIPHPDLGYKDLCDLCPCSPLVHKAV